MHKTRIITGIVGLLILVSIIYYGNLLLFWLMVSSVIVIGSLEFYKMFQAREFPVYLLPGVLLGWLLSWVPLISQQFEIALTGFTLTLIIIVLFLYALLTRRQLSEFLPAFSITMMGILYVSWLLSHLVFIRGWTDGERYIFYLLLIVWSGDTGAYYAGSFFGKHKLAPMISPKKTVEGALGGLAASLAASFIAKFTFLQHLSYRDCIVLALLMAVIAQLGDLCESMIKRGLDVKDSGKILPGHGGILDRVDGVMFAAPVLYYYGMVFFNA